MKSGLCIPGSSSGPWGSAALGSAGPDTRQRAAKERSCRRAVSYLRSSEQAEGEQGGRFRLGSGCAAVAEVRCLLSGGLFADFFRGSGCSVCVLC